MAVYNHELTEAEHVLVTKALSACRGAAIVSGYPSPLYDELYKGWRTVTFDIANHADGGESKQWKIETLWIKP